MTEIIMFFIMYLHIMCVKNRVNYLQSFTEKTFKKIHPVNFSDTHTAHIMITMASCVLRNIIFVSTIINTTDCLPVHRVCRYYINVYTRYL